ncbi:MAG: glucokinase [Microcystis sp.]|jgi:glucokinase|uniref:Glucokinase n=2 Tax=Microcystis aeruginosa TaxID=1126 RepID=A0A5A5R481_MICAE|nr:MULTISPECIES: glucokinase [Microcystis]MCZ8057366.1 glucokinase [Microcystis sp. LE19-12.2C]MDJ0547751.1 glucokinase [Microcystis sp. M49637_WE12]GBE74797.1 glucokinase [Microcystis aeruginosa NIES-87]KAB0241371.1 glucokinase [Microcystis aeruginosa EAWAG127a]MCA2718147.1 glucokinase [Microcystis sp. M169S2]
MLVLAGDIGGTNTRLCLVETDGKNESTLREEIYPSGNEGLVPLVRQFLGDECNVYKACFALAGPVLNNKCKITNLPWPELDAARLQEELNIAKVSLINDFVAIGYNIVLEKNKSLVTLQEGEFLPDAPIAIIGAGTGLGKAFAVPEGDSYRVFPTEGGHESFAPDNLLAQELLAYLRADGKVDVERVVSGPGIVDIFRFLQDRKFASEDVGDFLSQFDPGAAIAKGAAAGHFLCQQTMAIFVEAFGAAAGDMAVSFLPFGGLYIAGGIAAQNIELMQNGSFIKAFTDKARVNPVLLEKVPVHIVLNTLEGLRGAVKYAATKM